MEDIIKENVIGTYSSKENLGHYKKIGLWEAEKILFKRFFTRRRARLLDIGCGGGRTTIPLAKMGCDVTAFDITPAMVKLAKEALRKHKLSVKIEVGDATKIRYPSDIFDYALFSFNSLEAIPGRDNRQKALKEICRVLKIGGIFIFTTNTTDYYKGKSRFLIIKEALKYYLSKAFKIKNRYTRINDFEYGDCFLPFTPPMFIHFSTPKDVKDSLKKVGFKLIYSEFRDVIENKENPNLTKDYFYVCKKI